MSTTPIQVGETSWVDPEEVAAIVWDEESCRFPVVITKGGARIKADAFRVKPRGVIEDRQEVIKKLGRILFGSF